MSVRSKWKSWEIGHDAPRCPQTAFGSISLCVNDHWQPESVGLKAQNAWAFGSDFPLMGGGVIQQNNDRPAQVPPKRRRWVASDRAAVPCLGGSLFPFGCCGFFVLLPGCEFARRKGFCSAPERASKHGSHCIRSWPNSISRRVALMLSVVFARHGSAGILSEGPGTFLDGTRGRRGRRHLL